MGTGVTFSISSLIFGSLLLIVYFSKKRLFLVENKMYLLMLITLIFLLIFEIGCFWAGGNINNYPFISELILKLYLIIISFYITIFSIYIFSITCKIKDLNTIEFKERLRKFILYWGVPFTIMIFAILILPLEVIKHNAASYTSGLGVTLLYSQITTSLIIWIYKIIKAWKHLDKIKIIPIVTFIILTLIATVIQSTNKGFILTGTIATIISVIMFYTVENPDLKTLNEMKLAKNNAEKANSAKSDFLSNMSHEIRTPLNAVVSYSREILEADNLDRAKEDALEVIKASEILLSIVGGILDISKIESGKLEIEDVVYDPHELFKSVSSLINVKMNEKSLDFNVRLPKDLPSKLIGDKANIQKVLINLLSNAYKYTNEGKVDLVVDCINKNNTSRLIISVEDTGRGIKPELIDKLFDKFDRLEADRNTTTEGTGLGLAITKKLVELMNGKITVQSVYGSGSRFTIILDQKIKEIHIPDHTLIKTQALNLKNELNQALDEDLKRQDFSGKKILLVDDNPTNLKIGERLLSKYNIETTTHLNGEVTLKANVDKFDLIILDIEMPGIKGTDVMLQLKKQGFKKPIIAWTANATSGDKEKYLESGFNNYLTKPVELDKLNHTLNKYLK